MKNIVISNRALLDSKNQINPFVKVLWNVLTF